jgi:hypothetical protein
MDTAGLPLRFSRRISKLEFRRAVANLGQLDVAAISAMVHPEFDLSLHLVASNAA